MGKRWLTLIWLCLLAVLGGAYNREEAAQAGAWEAGMPEQTKYVALTFDDGPQPETTERLLDGLRQRGAAPPSSWWESGQQPVRSWCAA